MKDAMDMQMMVVRDYINKKKIEVYKEPCPCCDGYGYVENVGEPGYDACYRCGNTGWVNKESNNAG